MSNSLVLESSLDVAIPRGATPVFAQAPTRAQNRSNDRGPVGLYVVNATDSITSYAGYLPISQALATARAAEDILGLPVPTGARNLRQLAAMAELLTIHSSLLPGALSGPDGLPITSFGLSRASLGGDFAVFGAAINAFAMSILGHINGAAERRPWLVPGGVLVRTIDASWRPLRERADTLCDTALRCLDRWDKNFAVDQNSDDFGAQPSAVIALTTDDGGWSLDGTRLRIIDTSGKMLECRVDPERLDDVIDTLPRRQVAPMYYRPYGSEAGRFIAGPLARINVAEYINTPLANGALKQLRNRFAVSMRHRAVQPSLAHHARLIEIIAALEAIACALNPLTSGGTARVEPGGIRSFTGIGMHESPFGTLLHRLVVDPTGMIIDADLMGT